MPSGVGRMRWYPLLWPLAYGKGIGACKRIGIQALTLESSVSALLYEQPTLVRGIKCIHQPLEMISSSVLLWHLLVEVDLVYVSMQIAGRYVLVSRSIGQPINHPWCPDLDRST